MAGLPQEKLHCFLCQYDSCSLQQLGKDIYQPECPVLNCHDYSLRPRECLRESSKIRVLNHKFGGQTSVLLPEMFAASTTPYSLLFLYFSMAFLRLSSSSHPNKQTSSRTSKCSSAFLRLLVRKYSSPIYSFAPR